MINTSPHQSAVICCVLTSSHNALFNSLSSISRILAYLLHSSDIVRECKINSLNSCQNFGNAWLPVRNKHHVTFTKPLQLLIGWFLFISSTARTKIVPRNGEEVKTQNVRTWAEVHAAPVEPPTLVEPPVPDVEAPPTLGDMEKRMVERLEEVGGHWSCCLPNSWPRWLQRLGHQCWMGRNQPERSSNQQ